tara:strand:+ start:1980 stop:2192 length:213 start_codon:yes stop_codon:yes gene_type:complete
MIQLRTLAKMKKKPIDPNRSLRTPKDRPIQARKVHNAHVKYGKGSLSPEQIDEIPGIEILGGKEKVLPGL